MIAAVCAPRPLSTVGPRCLHRLVPRLGVVLCTLLGVLAGGSLSAQPGEWASLGPEGGLVNVFATVQDEPDRIYAGTSTGVVFRSEDGGATWERRGSLLGGLRALSVNPANSELLVAVARRVEGFDAHDEVHVSEDGGRVWRRLEGPFGDEVLQILAVPAPSSADPPSLLVRVRASASPSNLWRSTDGGETWTPVSVPDTLGEMLQDPAEPHVLWAPSSGSPVFRSEDGGVTWAPAATGLPGDERVDRLALGGDPEHRTLVAEVGRNRLFFSDDGGRSWEEPDPTSFPDRLEEDFVREVDLDAVDPDRVYVRVGPGGLNRPSRLLMSENGGRTYADADGFPEGVHALQPLPGRPGEALLGLERAGVWKMTGGGTAFRPSHEGLVATVVSSFAQLQGPVPAPLFSVASGELYTSTVRGSSWKPVTGLAGALEVAASPGSRTRLYAVSGDRVARSRDGGATWELSPPGATPCVQARELSVAPSAPGTLLVTGRAPTAACGIARACWIYKSTDGGRSFSCARGNLRDGTADEHLFDPRDPATAYLSRFGDIWRTRDGGELWQRVREELPATTLAASPQAPAVIWAGTEEGEVWQSPDRGDTWFQTPFPTPEVAPPPEVLSLTFDPRDPDTLYAVLERIGVFVTRDAGESWHFLGQVSPDSDVSGALAVDLADPRRLYAGTEDQGVFRSLQLDTSPCVPDAATLCLHDERFEVEVAWEDFQGGQGVGHAMPETGDSGWFWFFEDENVELLIKVLDARTINQKFWVFYGALSNVAYTITVRDTETGEVRLYPNPSRRFASVGDTAAFPLEVGGEEDAEGAAVSAAAGIPVLAGSQPTRPVVETTTAAGTCEPDATTLCLQDGRFRVRVEWRDFQGGEGEGQSVPLVRPGSSDPVDDSGFFWFFEPDNLELVVKVIDGRTVNGNFWFFYGALSNVEYRIEVVDVDSGRRAVFENPSRRFGSFGDTETFDGSAFCGGIAGFPCLESQVCDPDPGSCQVADVGGTCRERPGLCPAVFDPVCGCDGRSYGNDCERLRAGVAKDHDEMCTGQVCGTFAGIPCSQGDFCEFPVGSCEAADIPGLCEERPEACILLVDPVCGCDGVTYDNDCFRRSAGVTKDHDGPCV